jgi:hypothetical protein
VKHAEFERHLPLLLFVSRRHSKVDEAPMPAKKRCRLGCDCHSPVIERAARPSCKTPLTSYLNVKDRPSSFKSADHYNGKMWLLIKLI